jgi:DNA-binding MarR family transcriptional regulator
MAFQGCDTLRELVRLLVRKLGILEKSDSCCCGVTLTQCHAIVEIGRKGQISLNELADMLGLDKSTMSRTVNNLVESGLVDREADTGNRRYVVIQLNEKGLEVFKSIEESNEGYYESVMGSIPEEKREQVAESLELLLKAIAKTECCEKEKCHD